MVYILYAIVAGETKQIDSAGFSNRVPVWPTRDPMGGETTGVEACHPGGMEGGVVGVDGGEGAGGGDVVRRGGGRGVVRVSGRNGPAGA